MVATPGLALPCAISDCGGVEQGGDAEHRPASVICSATQHILLVLIHGKANAHHPMLQFALAPFALISVRDFDRELKRTIAPAQSFDVHLVALVSVPKIARSERTAAGDGTVR